jgi:hypothetical protein
VPEARRVEFCRLCGGPTPTPFLNLGETPIANALLAEDLTWSEPSTIEIRFCGECSLVPADLWLQRERSSSRSYPYFSSFLRSLPTRPRAHAVADREPRPDHESLVVEVASNDGYLLRNFVEAGIPARHRADPVQQRPPARSASRPSVLHE